MTTRICCLADIHGFLDKIDVPLADVLVIAGDITMMGTIEQITTFNKDLGYLPHKYKLVAAGNHDFLFEKSPSLAKSLITNGIYLQDEEIVINGIKFYLSPASPTFGCWAFNYDRGEEIRRVWRRIPDNCDILITHGPAMGILDEVTRDLGIYWEPDGEGNQRDFGYKIEHVGCQDLLNKIKEVKPLIHCYGHIHKHGGQVIKEGKTSFINASICNERYQPVNKPVVLEIQNKTVKIIND